MGLKTLMCPRIYPQRCLQTEFLALSIAVNVIETQVANAISSKRRPPSNLTGRKTASILTQAFISQLRPSPWASSTSRCLRIKVLSSRTSVSNSLRSFEDRISGFPPQRPSSWHCRSLLLLSCIPVFAFRFGLETEGAVLIKLMGRRARPDEVYKTYRHKPIVVNNPRVNVSARSPSNHKSRFVSKQST